MYEEKYNYFITIAKEGNLTKASEKLYISQPALSKYIDKLEAEIGVKLIERNKTPIKLTEGGKIYFEFAQKVISDYENMKKEIEGLGLNNKTITFGIARNLSQYFLNDVIQCALKIDRDFDFRIVEETSLNMRMKLKKGEMDIAFLSSDVIDDNYIEYTPIKKDCIYLMCSKNNPVIKNKDSKIYNGHKIYDITKEEFMNLGFYSRGEGFLITEVINKKLKSMNIEMKNVTEVADLESLYYLLSVTNKFAFIPQFFIEEKNDKELAVCSIEGHIMDWYIVMAKVKGRKLSEQQENWLNEIKKIYNYK